MFFGMMHLSMMQLPLQAIQSIGILRKFMLIKIFYSTSSSAKIHSTSLMWEPLRE